MILMLVVIGLSLLWRWYKGGSKSEPPVIKGAVPILGHTLMALGHSTEIYKRMQEISEETHEKGGVIRGFFGPVTLYSITDPEDAHTVSNMCLQKHFLYDMAEPIFKNGLFTADAHTWKKNRKLLNPAFTHQVLVSLLDTFNSQARRLVVNFAKEEGKPFDHEIYVRINNLETICMTAFGTDAQEFGDLQEKYVPHYNKAVDLVDHRLRKVWLMSDIFYNMTSMKKDLDRSVGVLTKLAESIVSDKLKGIKNAAIKGDEAGQLTAFTRTILKVASDGDMTDEEVRGEIDTMIAAGHDTTASTLTLVLTMLGSHQDVQEKVYTELIQVIGDSDRNFEKDDLTQLTYMEAVIKETLRLYPILPIIARQTQQDIKLKNYTLKANRGVFISLHGILRHKVWGPDRHEFRPERWLEKDGLPDPKYYAAFGLGRRFCIGKMYAMLFMKIALAHILRQYKISSDVSKLVIRANPILRPATGHHISVLRRL